MTAFASYEAMGDTEADHRCPTCGGWWASCDCPNVPDAVRCRACGLLIDLTHMEPAEAVSAAADLEAVGGVCCDCFAEGRQAEDPQPEDYDERGVA